MESWEKQYPIIKPDPVKLTYPQPNTVLYPIHSYKSIRITISSEFLDNAGGTMIIADSL